MIVKSKRLRAFASGRDCSLRLPVCNFDPSTTVLAHLPCCHGGMGMKGPDTVAVLACSACHDLVDGRRKLAGFVLELRDVLRALAETHCQAIEAGVLVVAGVKR